MDFTLKKETRIMCRTSTGEINLKKRSYIYKGQMIEIGLGQFGYRGYFAEVLYQCDDKTGKSLVTMFLVKKDKDGEPTVFIPVQKSQYITSDRSDIKSNIMRIVEYMCRTRRINSYLPEGVVA